MGVFLYHDVRRVRLLAALTVSAMTCGFLAATVPAAQAAPRASKPGGDAPVLLTPKGGNDNGADDAGFDKLRDSYYWSRLLAGDGQISLAHAAALRSTAVTAANGLPVATKSSNGGGTWTNQGPSPIVQVARTSSTFQAVSGRVGALAIRKDGTVILGAAQGGIWTYDATTGTWTSRSKDLSTQAVGALAIAPSNDDVVYMGSGEAALSGDSYFGDGIYRSADGGVTWKHVSTTFTGQSVSDIAIDPTNANHLYASTIRGRGGNHRVSAPTEEPYGVWESTDAGRTWTLRKGTRDQLHGATDLVMDPQHPNVLFASFWGDGIYRSADGGLTWRSALGDLPKGNFLEGGTRFALGISHPSHASTPTLYTGFDYFDVNGVHQPAQVFKSTDEGVHWTATGTGTGIDSILNYCATQCSYDNEVKPDPTNPNIVYVLGQYNYGLSPQSGGIYRSKDGGATWQSLGYDLHPDYHAIAFQPNNTKHIAIGNDGGVWQSYARGGRNGADKPLTAVNWEDLNGQVDPATTALIHSTGLAITMFDSIATVPNVPGQYWGGTQDNGTLRKSTTNPRWYDQASGDGGQVIVDQTTVNPLNPTVPAWVFGSYYSISPYRYNPAKTNTFFGNEPIDGGIDMTDRSEFYVPWAQNRGNVNQMFLGTYRIYRTNNAETPSAGDVHWDPISPDLTSGCTGAAPNGARGCLISTVGLSDGGTGVYAGTDEGWISVSPDATTAANPAWHRVGAQVLPHRPVDQIAVDRSNWRIAYAAFGGFSVATPNRTGHLYKTTDGGTTWTDISGALPDVPLDSVVIDPSHAGTLYVGSDVGAFVTTNGGAKWYRLGTGMPKVANWQLDYDASHGLLISGTHGRGAYTLTNRGPLPALVVSKTAADVPIGPGTKVDYTLTLRNIGNAKATGVTVTDPLPAHTTGILASGGAITSSGAKWTGLTVPAGSAIRLHLTVRIDSHLSHNVKALVNDGISVTSAQRVSTTGSPTATAIAPAHAVSVTPASALEGAKVGASTTFVEHVTNEGYQSDSYSVHPSVGGWAAAVYDATCTTPITTTPTVASGASTDVCLKVAVPMDAADNARDETTLTATSVTDPSVSGTATLTSIAVAKDTLLVDEDTNAPVDSAPYYENALTANGVDYSYWDLTANPELPQSYLTAHKTVVWFTGNSYPAPITPYETELKALLDGGGRLFMSGQDLLDQAAGTTSFVHDYLHINWDGTDVQNDQATAAVHSVSGNPVTDGIGTVPLDHTVLKANYEDEITPIDPASAAFTDDASQTDALTVAADSYKVVFLAFPFEAYGTAAQKADLMGRSLAYFGQA